MPGEVGRHDFEVEPREGEMEDACGNHDDRKEYAADHRERTKQAVWGRVTGR